MILLKCRSGHVIPLTKILPRLPSKTIWRKRRSPHWPANTRHDVYSRPVTFPLLPLLLPHSEFQVFSQPRAHFPHLSTWAISWSALGLAHISPSLRSSVTTALSMIVRSQDFPSLLPRLIFLYNIYYHLTYNLPIFCFFFAVSFHT